MALNRFIAIELPHYYRRTVSSWVGFSTLLTPWIIGVSFILPAYFGIGGEFLFSPTSGACYQKANGNAYILVEFAMGFYVPIALTGLLYSIIFFRLSFLRVRAPRIVVQPPRIAIVLAGRSGALHVDPEEPQLLNAGRAKRIAKAKILLASFVWYCLCFVPGSDHFRLLSATLSRRSDVATMAGQVAAYLWICWLSGERLLRKSNKFCSRVLVVFKIFLLR